MNLVPSDLRISVGSSTESAGRATNEDSVLVTQLPAASVGDEPAFLLAVADGMGGHERGEVASRIAIDRLNDLFARERPADVALALKQAYRRANEAIYQQSFMDGEQHSMGTTLVSAVVRGNHITIANVGDSRAYLTRGDQLTQVTQDHSVVAEQVAQGTLSEEEARISPQRNLVTHSLGTMDSLDRRLPNIYELTLLPEDRVLLCSDGYFDVLAQEDYLDALRTDDPQGAATRLSAMAMERGTTDNVSAVVVAVSPSTATMQRERLGSEIAAARTGMPPLLLPVLVILILLVAIAVGAFVYL